MRFGPVPLAQAQGAILAHSVPLPDGGRLRKGAVIGADDLAALTRAGVPQVVVAQLDAGDIPEDTAADRLARAILPDGVEAGLQRGEAFTGRVNVHAACTGVLQVDAAAVHAANRIDPAITLATLPPFARVAAGDLAGTVKIISYAVAEDALQQAEALLARAMRVAPVVLRDAGLILTEVAGLPDKLTEKARGAVAARLSALGMELAEVRVIAHDEAVIASAMRAIKGEMILILTASATSDLHDTAPQGVRMAGGHVARFGMPVDPGNLLFYGDYHARPVIGLPGCARSPALNGADFVLERLACGLGITDDDIAAMGVGGLLKEIPIRPAPREGRGKTKGGE